MLCPRCKQAMQTVFEVKNVVVFDVPPLLFKQLIDAPRKRMNPKAKVEEPLLVKPEPLRVRVVWLPRVALYYCSNCLTFFRDAHGFFN